MQTTESLKRKLDTTESLQSVVKTMKSLAASNIRQYEQAVESLAEYTRAIELGFHALFLNKPSGVRLQPRPGGSSIVLVFGSDQGMCGQLNDLVAEHADKKITELNEIEPTIIAIGHRLAGRLEDSGYKLEEQLEVPGSADGITSRVQDLLVIIENLRKKKNAGAVTVFYNKYESGASYTPTTLRLLPIDNQWIQSITKKDWPTNMIPQFRMPPEQLFSSLLQQYFFVYLFRAFAESLASENASRLASMQGAEKNIEDRISELTTTYNQQRQKAITEELLDIISGFTTTSG